MTTPQQQRLRLIDNDNGEISVTYNGKEIRGWYYHDDAERRVKMLAAREFTEGWYEGYSAGLDWSEQTVVAGIEKLFSSPTEQ